ncbi:MAG: hypothetical protein KAJ62_13535 [Desulfobacteraceae bacterium]|nr:hypothetical protein [Desulfobacteraceae bacterium]
MNIYDTSNRYYLNGIDWVMAALNLLNKKKTGVGNHSQLVLVLKGYLDKDNLAKRLSTILSKSSFYKGKAKRAWHLAPYWNIDQQTFFPEDMKFFKLESLESSEKLDNKELDHLIYSLAKTPFKDDKTLLAFDLIHCNKFTYLIMKFDHKMFDARGAESLLEYILNKQDSDKQYHLPAQGAQLNLWKSRFLSGQQINRFLRSIYSKKIKVASLKKIYNQNPEPQNSYNFFRTTFSEDQVKVIDNNTIKKAGYLMHGIYILSFVAKAFDSLFKARKTLGNILIPINVDVRETKFTKEKIFFNNVSFMLFNIKHGLSVTEYIKSLKTQFIEQVRNKIPYHFINASLLMRIVPLKILSSFMNFRMKKNSMSFSFSYISEQAFFLKQVDNLEVVNLFHIPLVPVSPGVGIFFTRFNKKLNMIISGSGNKLGSQDGKYLQEKIISGMLDGKV